MTTGGPGRDVSGKLFIYRSIESSVNQCKLAVEYLTFTKILFLNDAELDVMSGTGFEYLVH